VANPLCHLCLGQRRLVFRFSESWVAPSIGADVRTLCACRRVPTKTHLGQGSGRRGIFPYRSLVVVVPEAIE
jgi:hypothetical protein